MSEQEFNYRKPNKMSVTDGYARVARKFLISQIQDPGNRLPDFYRVFLLYIADAKSRQEPVVRLNAKYITDNTSIKDASHARRARRRAEEFGYIHKLEHSNYIAGPAVMDLFPGSVDLDLSESRADRGPTSRASSGPPSRASTGPSVGPGEALNKDLPYETVVTTNHATAYRGSREEGCLGQEDGVCLDIGNEAVAALNCPTQNSNHLTLVKPKGNDEEDFDMVLSDDSRSDYWENRRIQGLSVRDYKAKELVKYWRDCMKAYGRGYDEFDVAVRNRNGSTQMAEAVYRGEFTQEDAELAIRIICSNSGVRLRDVETAYKLLTKKHVAGLDPTEIAPFDLNAVWSSVRSVLDACRIQIRGGFELTANQARCAKLAKNRTIRLSDIPGDIQDTIVNLAMEEVTVPSELSFLVDFVYAESDDKKSQAF